MNVFQLFGYVTSLESIEKLFSNLVFLIGPLTLFIRLVALSRRAVILLGSVLLRSSVESTLRLPG